MVYYIEKNLLISINRRLLMTKIQEVQSSMIQAMKNREANKKETLSLLLAALKLKAKEKQADLTQEEENEIILKEIKQTKETMESAPPDREDIITQCQERLVVLQEFAPKQMSEEEIQVAIQQILVHLQLEHPTNKEKGLIMKHLMPLVKGKADGQLVNQLVSQLLQK